MLDPALQRLARLYGVQAAFRDGFRQMRPSPPEALLAVLRSLGVEVAGPEDVPRALRRAEIERWQCMLDPVRVAWLGREPPCRHVSVNLRLPAAQAGRYDACLDSQARGPCRSSGDVRDLRRLREANVRGQRYALLALPLPGTPLPAGYYRYCVNIAGRQSDGLLVCAPRSCVGLERGWGVFAPLYALHSRHSGGIGTFADLSRLTAWVGQMGGSFVSTLPLLASFLSEPFAPSPYTPVSRCFWNEIYVDLPSVPEWSPECGGMGAEIAGRHVDYRALMRSKRAALEAALSRLAGPRRESFVRFVGQHAELRSYAAFRSGVERRLSDPPGFDLQDSACAYHAFAQWTAEEQINAIALKGPGRGPELHLDLPLGVHPRGFDSYRYPHLFAPGVAGGAPPDRFFSKGQNWGFAPVNPRRAREQGHAYWIACIRHHMRHAAALRIDHLMGLHRLYWIPQGFDGDQGVYVRYPAEELYAILCLESQRSGTAVVGEDLGTVPRYVRQRMANHGLRRMYVGQFEYRGRGDPPFDAPPPRSVASLNTHDTAMFASFWTDRDIAEQVALGLLDKSHAADVRQRRRQAREALLRHLRKRRLLKAGETAASAVLRACLATLAASDAECVIVALEDLWGEAEPQNTPGTGRERPNWTRRMRLSLEQIQADPGVASTLEGITGSRHSAGRDKRWIEGRSRDF